jgi:hypothetical protein
VEHAGHLGILHPAAPSTRDVHGPIISPDRARGIGME